MGMNDFNPYQTPASDEPAQGCWRRGGKVWLAAGSALPCRCIRCAAETAAEEGKNVNLYWTPPAALLLSAAAVVLFFIFAPVLFAWLDEWKAPVLIVLALLFTAAQIWLQRKRRLFVPVCRRCRRRLPRLAFPPAAAASVAPRGRRTSPPPRRTTPRCPASPRRRGSRRSRRRSGPIRSGAVRFFSV